MAAPFQAAKRLFQLSSKLTPTLSRSAFRASKVDPDNPNWVAVGLTFTSTAAVWFLLVKHHYYELEEYERRKAGQDT